MDTLRPDTLPTALGRSWSRALTWLGVYVLWLLALYWETPASMVSIWYRSDTFAHGFLVLPIAGWLVWRMRRDLEALSPSPSRSPWPIVAMVVSACIWFAGDLADVLAARQLAWVTLLVAGVWLLLGDQITRRLAFPLAFLYLAVPIGEFLMPTLIEWTADFTVAALRASGVPVVREGMQFEIPTGTWSVVEACSGLRYLIASATVGVLYAYLTYRSMGRRIAFVIASLIVPLVANWLRAYMIVMIGHLSNNRLAVGVDHFVYGWLFFGLVMLLLFWIGTLWREDADNESTPNTPPLRVTSFTTPHAGFRSYAALIGALVLTAAAPAAVSVLRNGDLSTTVVTSAPPLGDWQPVAGSLVPWKPQFTEPRSAIASTYQRAAERAGVYIALYYDQTPESKLISSENQLIRTTDRFGHVISERHRTIDTERGSFSFQETVLRVRDGRIVARSWFWIDGTSTASPIRAKFAQAYARLRGRGDAGAIVVVYALLPPEGPIESAALENLTRQAKTALPPILAERLRGDDAG